MVAIAAEGRWGRRNPHDVLVVTGERHIARLIQVNLERQNYRVGCANSARAALDHIAEEAPDFIVIDAVLPDLDDYALTRQIRGTPETALVTIMLLLPSEADAPSAWSAGADSYLVKPFDPAKLIQTLRSG